jgi:ADP-ribose pyrophosphatase YjhB (NUDIX family)
MNLYIDDKFIKILKESEPVKGIPGLEITSISGLKPENLRGTVYINNVSNNDISTILGWLELKKLGKLDTIICRSEDYIRTKEFIKSQFRIIRAAGGLVQKEDKFLLIYRLGKWDLPKGKLEKDEKSKIAAVREVGEECGVDAEIIDKLTTTWHTYIQEGKRILKKSTWYNMNCIDDSHMEPQYVENIEEIRWMNHAEVQQAMKNSFRSIKGVFEAFADRNEKLV